MVSRHCPTGLNGLGVFLLFVEEKTPRLNRGAELLDVLQDVGFQTHIGRTVRLIDAIGIVLDLFSVIIHLPCD